MDSQNKNRSGLKKILSVALMGSICLTAAVSIAATSKTVTVTDGESTMTINTTNPDTEAVLSKAGVELGKDDKLVRTDDGENSTNISILRAANVEASGNNAKEAVFNESSVADAFLTAGLTLTENESVSLAALEASNTETDIKLERVKITVDLRGKKITKEVPTGTVKEALEYLDIKLGKNDIVSVDIKTDVEEGLEIEIKKVEYKNVTEKKTIDYKTIYKETDELYVGETSVGTEGVEGERTIVKKVKYVNGEEESSEVVSDKVTKKAIDQVIYTGTVEEEEEEEEYEYEDMVYANSGEVTISESTQTITDTNGNEVAYTQVLTGSGTAYYAPAGAGTATGRLARYGVVAVNPDIIPYGSILYIVSNDGEIVYGYAVAGDTGGALMDGSAIVDLFYNTYDECCVFGRRDVTIYVLDGVSEDVTYQ